MKVNATWPAILIVSAVSALLSGATVFYFSDPLLQIPIQWLWQDTKSTDWIVGLASIFIARKAYLVSKSQKQLADLQFENREFSQLGSLIELLENQYFFDFIEAMQLTCDSVRKSKITSQSNLNEHYRNLKQVADDYQPLFEKVSQYVLNNPPIKHIEVKWLDYRVRQIGDLKKILFSTLGDLIEIRYLDPSKYHRCVEDSYLPLESIANIGHSIYDNKNELERLFFKEIFD